MSHRQRDERGFKLYKKNARPRTKLRWEKRHMKFKQMSTTQPELPEQQVPQISSDPVDTSGFTGMKKVDL